MNFSRLFRQGQVVLSKSVRTVQVFAATIFIICSWLLLVATQAGRIYRYVFDSDDLHSVLLISQAFGVYLILISVVSYFAALIPRETTYKLLALISVINLVTGLSILATTSPKTDLIRSHLLLKLTEFQSRYDWNHKNDTSPESKSATLAWDIVQTDLQCCGLSDPKEWLNFRSKHHEQDNELLPMSCCKSIGKNKKDTHCRPDRPDNIWPGGCSACIDFFFKIIKNMMIFITLFNGLLAAIYLWCKPHGRQASEGQHY